MAGSHFGGRPLCQDGRYVHHCLLYGRQYPDSDGRHDQPDGTCPPAEHAEEFASCALLLSRGVLSGCHSCPTKRAQMEDFSRQTRAMFSNGQPSSQEEALSQLACVAPKGSGTAFIQCFSGDRTSVQTMYLALITLRK